MINVPLSIVGGPKEAVMVASCCCIIGVHGCCVVGVCQCEGSSYHGIVLLSYIGVHGHLRLRYTVCS